MIYSKTCESALRALIFFADHPEQRSATVEEVSEESHVPSSYVAKIFQCLVRSKILRSQRGPAGGYSLAVPAGELTLIMVVHALDDPSRSPLTHCVMGFQKCNDKDPCPLHPVWKKAKEEMVAELEHLTLRDVAALGNKFRYGKQRRFTLSKRMRDIFSAAK